ncbi:toprim domain-containing protein [Rubrolithibacter danxiaensis]|uniref:toprim domain-containing protein n=1 Tax=Rubrolithibacter danxiaensis TaxID=3390805 RepID=UPI003BF904E8
MDIRNKRLPISEVREMDMVSYLSALGHEPSKIRSADYWYLSPLREEKIPSFKINRKLNRWYDHGLGKGGNLIDFAILYHGCTIGELFEKLSGNLFVQKPIIYLSKTEAESGNRIKIVKDFTLTSDALLRYLQQRRIPISVADGYCREVRYELNDKTYYGIGFKNDSGGYEIRNPYYKCSSSPKDITTLRNGSDEVTVFEGFIDFLSFRSIHRNEPLNRSDFVVLNSLSFFEKARPFMEKHQTIRLYLDRDTAGQNCSRYAESLSIKYSDESGLYKHYKDFNDWVMNFGRSSNKPPG